MNQREIITIIKNDGIGILSTDTVYGLIASAFSKKAVERIYRIKGRDKHKPLIILISSIKDLEKFGVSDSLIRANRRIVENVWPGKVSVIFPIQKKFSYLDGGTQTLAFRLPDNKILQNIIKVTGPLVAPSANPQGLSPARTTLDIKKYFKNNLDFVVFKKGRPSAQSSTLISLAGEKPIVLREGAVKVRF